MISWRETPIVPTSLPPSPSTSSATLGLRLALDPFGFLSAARDECGDTFTLRMPDGVLRVVTCNPDHVRTIFALPIDAYQMADQAIPLNLGKHSLLFLDGERHRGQHRLLMPPLHGKHLRLYAALIERATHQTIGRWSQGEPFALLEEMQWITMTAICQCVLGVHEGEQIDRLRHIVKDWLKGPMSSLALVLSMIFGVGRVRRFFDEQVETSPISFPNPEHNHRLLPWRRQGDAKAELMSMLVADLEALRRDGCGDRVDLLAMLAQTREEASGELMPIAEAVDQLVTLLVGGYETTANALCWVIHHIIQSPSALARVRTENLEFVGAELGERRPWLDACIKEALRLKPIAPMVNRSITRPVQLGAYLIPAGTILWPCIYLTHVNKDIYADPLRFDPERFHADQKPRANEWLAFGGGQRRCIGAAFAEYEMRIVVSILLDRVDFEHVAASRSRPIIRGITVSPSDRMRVVAKRIRGRRAPDEV
jgi:cytochrome P450 family 110